MKSEILMILIENKELLQCLFVTLVGEYVKHLLGKHRDDKDSKRG